MPLIRFTYVQHLPPEGKAKNKEINKASPWGEALPQSGGDEGQFHRRKSKNIQTNGLKKTAHFNQTNT